MIDGISENYFYSSFGSFSNNTSLNRRSFTVTQLNVRGINNITKFQSIKKLLLKMTFQSDIILLGETKLKQRSNLYHLNGYTMHFCCRLSDHCGGGLILYVRNGLPVTDVVKSTSCFEKIKIKLQVMHTTIQILAYYRPPVPASVNPFLLDLEDELCSTSDKVILIGDVNLNAFTDTPDSSKYVSLLTSYDLSILNRHATRNDSGRVIDHLATNLEHEHVLRNFTITNRVSDHNIVISQFPTLKSVPISRTITLSRTNYDKMRQLFESSVQSAHILQSGDPEEITTTLTDCIKNALRDSTTSIKIKVKNCHKLRPWFNAKVLLAIHKKEKAINRWKKNRRNMHLKSLMKLMSTRLKLIIKQEKIKYIAQKVSEKDPKKLWRNINEIIGRKKKSEITSLSVNGTSITEPVAMCQVFNEFFVDSISALNSSLKECSVPPKLTRIPKTIFWEDTDEYEIAGIIRQLKSSAAPGIDGIKATHLKTLDTLVVPFLTHLVNRIFETSKFPSSLKLAVVVPINKSSDVTNVKDYRPISILPVFSKIIERCILNRIEKFTHDHLGIIYRRQYGFRKKCNTEIAAVELVDAIRTAIDKKKKLSAVFLDLRRAFDAVDVNRLLESLECLGIRQKPLDLVRSFLNNRRQIVRLGEARSPELSFTQGVVQGSMLGPCLFVLFINHISNLQLNGQLYIYADDCVLLNTHSTDESVDEKIRRDLVQIINFLNYQKLILNTDKTFFMVFKSCKLKTDDPQEIVVRSLVTDSVQIDGDFVLKRTDEFKYLGLILDESLKFDRHIAYVAGKTSSASGILWKLRHQLPQHIKKLIYQTLLETHLLYMLTVWGCASDELMKPLQIIQNRALRNVYNLDRLLNREVMYFRHVENCLPLRCLHFLKSSSFVYDCMNHKIHTNISFSVLPMRTNRREPQLSLSRVRTMHGRKCLSFMTAKIYNNVPHDIKLLRTSAAFRWALKCHLRSQSSLSIAFNGEYLDRFT